MANIQIKKGVSSVTRDTADGTFMPVRGTRDGALYSADWYDALALEGRVFVANGGSDTTPITFAGAYDANGPDLTIDIPDGTIAIPLYIEVVLQTTGASLFEIIALASGTLCATSAGTAVTPRNLRIDEPIASKATVYSAVDAAGCTDPHSGNYFEFFRGGYPSDPDVATTPEPTYRWSARKDGPPPIIADGGSIVVYASGTTGTGFITAVWAELPEGFMK